MRAFVTGGTGFVGGVLLRRLAERGVPVRALVRPGREASLPAIPGIEAAPGDLLDRDSLRAGMAGCDTVFHVAALYSTSEADASAMYEVNVLGTKNVLRAAADAGVPLTLFARGFSDLGAIVAPPPGTPLYKGRFAPAVDMVRRGLSGGREPAAFDGRNPARALDLVHWGEVDETGHHHGGVSAEYREEAAHAAAFLVRYAASLDLDQDALVVVSDHGHLSEGGHGGDEPEVSHAMFLAVGGLFRQGVELGERPMRDVASTLAVVGGLRTPSSNLGLPMLDTLALDDDVISAVAAAPFDEAARFLCRLHGAPPPPACSAIEPLVARLRRPDPAAWEEAQAIHADLSRERERALDARRARGGPRRLGAAAVLRGLAAAAASLALRRRPGAVASPGPRERAAAVPTLVDLLVPLVLTGVYSATLWAHGYRPTFSHLMPVPLFASEATPSGAAAVVAVAALAWARRPGPRAPWLLLAATVVPFALLAAWVGADPVTLPPNVAGVLVFLLGPVIPAAAVGATVLAWMEERRARAR
jgi:hypothetical protein